MQELNYRKPEAVLIHLKTRAVLCGSFGTEQYGEEIDPFATLNPDED